MSTAQRGQSLRHLARSWGVGPETLRKWVLHAQVDAGQRSGPTSEELAEITQLKKENAELRGVESICTVLRAQGLQGGPLPEVLYGRRKMTAWLASNGLPGVSKHIVDGLMRQEGMRGLVRGRKT